MEIGPWEVFWLACGVGTIIAALLANRSRRWRYVGRAAVGVLFLFGGALMNAIQLASGVRLTGVGEASSRGSCCEALSSWDSLPLRPTL